MAKGSYFAFGFAILMMLAGCGGNGSSIAVQSLSFPTSGGIDIQTAPAGTYLIKRIRSYTTSNSPDYGNLVSVFDHTAAVAGAPAKGDPISRYSKWGTAPTTGTTLAQLNVEINLNKTLTTTGSAATFSSPKYYWHYNRSDDSWQWYISGSDTTSGRTYADIFAAANRSATPAIYGSDAIRGTALMSGTDIVVYYEVKVNNADGSLSSDQIVELTYTKSN